MNSSNTIIVVKGNAWVPQRFWDYQVIEKTQLEEYTKKEYVVSNIHKLSTK